MARGGKRRAQKAGGVRVGDRGGRPAGRRTPRGPRAGRTRAHRRRAWGGHRVGRGRPRHRERAHRRRGADRLCECARGRGGPNRGSKQPDSSGTGGRRTRRRDSGSGSRPPRCRHRRGWRGAPAGSGSGGERLHRRPRARPGAGSGQHRARGRRGGRGGQRRRQWGVGHPRSKTNGAGGAVRGARPHGRRPCARCHLRRRHRGRGGRLEQARSQVGRGGAEGRREGRRADSAEGHGAGRGKRAGGGRAGVLCGRPTGCRTTRGPRARRTRAQRRTTWGARRSGVGRPRRRARARQRGGASRLRGWARGLGGLTECGARPTSGERGGRRGRKRDCVRRRRPPRRRYGLGGRSAQVGSGARPRGRRPCAPHPERRLHRVPGGRPKRARRQVRRGGAERRRQGGRADRARGQEGGARAVGVYHSGGARSGGGGSVPDNACGGFIAPAQGPRACGRGVRPHRKRGRGRPRRTGGGPAGGQGRGSRSSCRRAARRRGRGGTTAAGDRQGSRPTVAHRGAARRRGAGAREGSPQAAGVGRDAADDGGHVRRIRSGCLGGGPGQQGSEAAVTGRGGGPVDLPWPRGPARRAGGSACGYNRGAAGPATTRGRRRREARRVHTTQRGREGRGEGDPLPGGHRAVCGGRAAGRAAPKRRRAADQEGRARRDRVRAAAPNGSGDADLDDARTGSRQPRDRNERRGNGGTRPIGGRGPRRRRDRAGGERGSRQGRREDLRSRCPVERSGGRRGPRLVTGGGQKGRKRGGGAPPWRWRDRSTAPRRRKGRGAPTGGAVGRQQDAGDGAWRGGGGPRWPGGRGKEGGADRRRRRGRGRGRRRVGQSEINRRR